MDGSLSNLAERQPIRLVLRCFDHTNVVNKSPALRAIEQPTSYTPYAEVTDRKIKHRLLRIAHRFQFVDRGFTEYFQTVAPSFGRDNVQELLGNIRKAITASQNPQLNQGDTSDSIWLGELGHFCEEVAQHWNNRSHEPEIVITRGRSEDILHYLQNALEVPYWNMMLYLFSIENQL
jgi:hypothetical protein